MCVCVCVCARKLVGFLLTFQPSSSFAVDGSERTSKLRCGVKTSDNDAEIACFLISDFRFGGSSGKMSEMV